jgi:hypothetical protein
MLDRPVKPGDDLINRATTLEIAPTPQKSKGEPEARLLDHIN